VIALSKVNWETLNKFLVMTGTCKIFISVREWRTIGNKAKYLFAIGKVVPLPICTTSDPKYG
jgi:hypothetical protein